MFYTQSTIHSKIVNLVSSFVLQSEEVSAELNKENVLWIRIVGAGGKRKDKVFYAMYFAYDKG